MERIITQNGKSEYHIVTNQFAHEAELYAAVQLKEYLFRITGAQIPYFSDRCAKRGPEIRIGLNVRGNCEDVSMLINDGFRIYTDNDDIVITGKTTRGVIYGVFGFLEKFAGYRCFTKDIEHFNIMETFAVSDTDYFENPSFEYRDVYVRGAFDCDFAVKNRLNSSMALIPDEKGGKTKFYNFHHSFFDILPPDIYFESHPEYYSQVNGKRLREEGQLCLTNEDMINEAIKRVKEWIRSRPDCKIFSVAQNDWQNYCTCEKCRAMDEHEGSHSGTVIYFVNRIAEAVQKEFPDVLIHTFAYQYSRKAPKYIKPRNNVIVRLCNIECRWDEPMEYLKNNFPDSHSAEFVDNIREWSAICNHLYIWDYNCNFSFYILPFPNYRSLSANMKFYRDKGIAGMLQQGNFSVGNATALSDLQAYVTSKLLWNADADIYKAIDEFVYGCYGKAGKYIREYIDLLESSVKGHPLRLYYFPNAEYITDEMVNKADELFIKAINESETEEIKNRIKKEYLSVRFMKAARLPLEDKNRAMLVDELYEDVKKSGISEIQERIRLEVSFDIMRKYRYCDSSEGQYRLYYIMK